MIFKSEHGVLDEGWLKELYSWWRLCWTPWRLSPRQLPPGRPPWLQTSCHVNSERCFVHQIIDIGRVRSIQCRDHKFPSRHVALYIIYTLAVRLYWNVRELKARKLTLPNNRYITHSLFCTEPIQWVTVPELKLTPSTALNETISVTGAWGRGMGSFRSTLKSDLRFVLHLRPWRWSINQWS